MNVFVVVAYPPRGREEPWVSDVFATCELAKAYAAEMTELTDGVLYIVEQCPVRESLDPDIPDSVLQSEPFFKGLGEGPTGDGADEIWTTPL